MTHSTPASPFSQPRRPLERAALVAVAAAAIALLLASAISAQRRADPTHAAPAAAIR